MKIIRGKKALVTGAASGVGRAIALALAREGADLFLLDLDDTRLAAVADEARTSGVEVVARRCDLRDPDQISAAVRDLAESWRELHILVNNAGIMYYGNTGEMTDEQRNDVLAVNLLAPVQLVQELLPMLLDQEQAHIVNVCSMAGLVPFRKMAAYQATKFALVGLSRSLRAEFRRGKRLGVTALCPGVVDTDLVETARRRHWSNKATMPFARLSVSPERVAERAIKAVRRNRGLVLVSGHARFLWMLDRMWPGFFDFYEHWRDPLPGVAALAARVSPSAAAHYHERKERRKKYRARA